MDENCYVEPIYKNGTSAEDLRYADNVLLAIWGMGCSNCATRIRNSLLSLEGVYRVGVHLNLALAEVRYDSKKISSKSLVEAVSLASDDGRHEYRAQLIVE